MAKVQTSYADGRGKLHPTPSSATISDLSTLLGGNLSLAKSIFENRAVVEQIFEDHDEMISSMAKKSDNVTSFRGA